MKRLKSLVARRALPRPSDSAAASHPNRPASIVPSDDPVGLLGAMPIRVYGERDGLHLSSVEALTVDALGRIWVGTEDGAARYDGRAWTAVPMPPAARAQYVRAVLAGADGSIWFGLRGGGLAHLKGGRWRLYDLGDGLPHLEVRCLFETLEDDGSSTIWAGTHGGGLARLRDGRFTVFDTSNGLPDNRVTSIYVRRENGDWTIWVGTVASGLVCRTGGAWRSVDDVPRDLVIAISAGQAASGEAPILVGTNAAGLFRLESGQVRVYDTRQGLPSDTVWAAAETIASSGARSLWVGTSSGLARLERGSTAIYDGSNGLARAFVTALASTPSPLRPRTLWVGTDGGGVARIEQGQWTAFDASPRGGLPNAMVTCFAETVDDDGRALWIGMDGGGVARLRRGEWTNFGVEDGLQNQLIMCLAEVPAELVGGSGDRALIAGSITSPEIVRFEGGRWHTVALPKFGQKQRGCSYFFETVSDDGRPVLWIGTHGAGAHRLSEGRVTTIDASSGLPHPIVPTIYETIGADGTRTQWIGTFGGGLGRLRGDELAIENRSTGLPDDKVLCFFETRARGRRELWAGTYGGIAALDLDRPGARWAAISQDVEALVPGRLVSQIREDARGRIYLFTNKGVTRLTPRPGPGESGRFDSYTFTAENGLPALECNAGASFVDGFGRVWAGTVGGAAFFDPACEVEDRRPKPLYVERTLLDGQERALPAGASLRPDENNRTFELTLVSLSREAETRYRSQLVGFDRAPSSWTADYRRVYTNLPAGAYRFDVWGRDEAGNESGPIATEFSIRPAPWKSWWAYALYAGAIAAAGYGGARYRLDSLKRRQAALERTVSDRTAALAASEARTREQADALAEKAGELSRTVERLRVQQRIADEAREEALAERAKALESERAALEASRTKSVFLANVSHELRTPLNAILGFTQLMERSEALEGDDRANLAIIRRSGEHLLGLINDVLSLSKIEAGKLALDVRSFDLRIFLDLVQEMTRVRAEQKRLRLRFDVDAELPRWVRGDEVKLRQVLLNVLGNAVKFTNAGRIDVTVRLRGDRVAFEVTDSGAGISEKELGELFGAFVQTESGRRSQEGTGLGLAISREIVRLMGGDMRIQSEVGVGTTVFFEVELPLAPSGASAPLGAPRRAVALEPGQRVPRVLVVDDSEENRTALVRLLRVVGLAVDEASNGLEAIERWRRGRPDAIFMDMRMPVMDGLEATRRIRQAESVVGSRLSGVGRNGIDGDEGFDLRTDNRQPTPQRRTAANHPCKIVALTASAFEHERSEILANGVDDIVAKPFREGTIFAQLETHLGVRFVYRELKPAPEAVAEGGAMLERLGAVPAELRADLHRALLVGDDVAAAAIVRRITRYDESLARQLDRALREFQFAELLSLFERL